VVPTLLRLEAPAQEAPLDTLTVLVGAKPPRLLHAIEELLGQRPDFRIVGSAEGTADLAPRVRKLAPDVVVASLRALGRDHERIAQQIRQSRRATRLVLIHSVSVRPGDLRGADAHVDEQVLLKRLLPTIDRIARARQRKHETRRFAGNRRVS
jgi:DNA-binding NarL/FixJ family response regulator